MSTSIVIILIVTSLVLGMAGAWVSRRVEHVSRALCSRFDDWVYEHVYTSTGVSTLLCAAGCLTFAGTLAGSPSLQQLLAVPFAAIGFFVVFSGLLGLMALVLQTLEFLWETVTFQRDLRDDWDYYSGRFIEWQRGLRRDWNRDQTIGLPLTAMSVVIGLSAIALIAHTYWPMLRQMWSK
ncbi:MAG TPA: hypothetical protein VJJ47_01010 [Candidatus Paceibacterota bacterium]